MIPTTSKSLNLYLLTTTAAALLLVFLSASTATLDDSLTYIWPLPAHFTAGNDTLTVDPDLSLSFSGNSDILSDGFLRYKHLIFKQVARFSSRFRFLQSSVFDVSVLQIVLRSPDEELQLGVDESYSLEITRKDHTSIVGVAKIQANTVYGALRALETFSQLCTFDYASKSVKIFKAPWYIEDLPRFVYRGLLIDTSRHYLPIDVIKQILDSMMYAKLNVLHWHIVDEESFPFETPSYPYLWKGSYSKWERYTAEDAYEIVNYAKIRGIHVMPEIDVPGHAESWGIGYPDLWPSLTCKEPLDVSKNFTFDVVSGIMKDLKRLFPFELFHLGGDEVNTDCWNTTPHIKQWLTDRNMTTKDAYHYFVVKAQEIAISNNRTPVNWEETFINFPSKLNPRTVVHNWLVSGICPRAVAKGFRCIYSNQGVWYLDHLDVPWQPVYDAEPLEGISDAAQQDLILGGEVCMWGETGDTSDVQQTIWPRAAAAAERLWSSRESTSSGNINHTVLPRLHYFRCLLNMRGVQAAPVTNYFARRPPSGPGSCYDQ
ncbi:beta-hexosaminidase 1 [Silene latifolia]|uniref:beta-hexosaminidase 1 n=1 Tax=Silene latifolia TaxID=37657 RepID=UPI003D76F078